MLRTKVARPGDGCCLFYPLFDRLSAAENAINELTLVTGVQMRFGHNVVFSFLLQNVNSCLRLFKVPYMHRYEKEG